jgi:hypothetical protein
MNQTPTTLSKQNINQAAPPIIYKAFEFAKPSSQDDYVLVREYRTLYYLDGQVKHEVVLNETPFELLVNGFQGVVRKSGALLTGLFDAPEQARACARKVDDLYNKTVNISGNQISLTR